MENNIFMTNKRPITFEEYLQFDEKSRENLGEELRVLYVALTRAKEDLCAAN